LEGRDEYVENLFSQFRKDLEKAAKTLRQNIKVTEEGNSKAILIFTLVTIIFFLPLSFIVSVFGMNTSDIRDMKSNQTLFWLTALLVTGTVGTISLVVAYGHTDIVGAIQKCRYNLATKMHMFRHHRRPWNLNKHRKDKERADDSNSAAMGIQKRLFDSHRSDSWLHSKRWSSRRKNTDSHGPRVPVRTATGKTLPERHRKKVRIDDPLGSSE